MIISVRHPTLSAFKMTVRGFKGDINIDETFDTMDAVWRAAREMSEKHADFLTEQNEGWGP